MILVDRPKGVNGHFILKGLLSKFWMRFDGKKTNGIGFSKLEKIAALKELADTRIGFHKQQSRAKRREQFDSTKATLHPFRRFGNCFACGNMATARHHLIQIQYGGINSKKNLVSLCSECHAEIHPWLQ